MTINFFCNLFFEFGGLKFAFSFLRFESRLSISG
jgi:hypothetical protein